LTSYLVRQDHPLLALSLEKIKGWQEWKVLWQAASRFEQYLGLLHCGFDVTPVHRSSYYYDRDKVRAAEVDRVCFYLELADSFRESTSYFKLEEEDDQVRSPGGGKSLIEETAVMRVQLAQKAFDVLSQRFFRNTAREGDDLSSWVELVVDATVLKKVIWFFRLDEYNHIPNLGDPETPGVHEQWAKKFVVELCKLGWARRFDRMIPGYEHEARARLTAARPHFMAMLLGSGHIDLLLDRESYPLDEPSWQRLTELAYTERYIRQPDRLSYGSVKKKPVSLKEAAANRSEAARVLLLLQIYRAEDERFAALREAVDQEREARRIIRALAP